MTSPLVVADAVRAFFAEHEVASLRLRAGWFGRPHGNWHELTEASADDHEVVICLDEKQVLTVHVEGLSSQDRILQVAIRDGRWAWTEYGGEREHTEVLGPGTVEFHAAFHR